MEHEGGSSSDMLFTQQIDNSAQGDGGEDEWDDATYGKLISLLPEMSDINLTADKVTIGRQPSCTVCLKNPHLSGVHCELTRDRVSGITFVVDKSSNGTFVNNVQVGKNNRTMLKPMDEITLLPTKYARYMYKEREAVEDEAPGGPSADYHIQKTLGTGNFASVKLAVHKGTGEKFAIKCIDKKKMAGGSSRADAVRDEINILESVSHPHIIRIFKNYETVSTMYLVLELVEGGELFDFVVDRGCNGLPEDSAREIFRQIVDAVAYLHAKNISHRDLKPENILLAKKPVDEHGPFEVKLSDFGLSRLVGATSFMQTMCGTPSYLAPEVLGGEGSDKGYDVKVDIWSVGVILYILLSGRNPFDDSSGGNVLDRVKRGEFSFDERVWQDVSSAAMSCVKRCLMVVPSERISAKQLLQHPFLTGLPEPVEVPKPAAFAIPMGGGSSFAVGASAAAEPMEKKQKKTENLSNAVPVCKYGQSCFRKNPNHFKEFAHPWLQK